MTSDINQDELQLMDTDETGLQLEDETIITNSDDSFKNEEVLSSPSTFANKIRVYIRDGPNAHHVEKIVLDGKYYEVPTLEQLESIQITEDKYNEILESLNLTQENFRTTTCPSGKSRPESLYVRGVSKMSTQEIFDCFENFTPIGIEWVCDHSCNIFWNDVLNPLNVLITLTVPGPSISSRRSTDFEDVKTSLKRKLSTSDKNEDNSVEIALPPGHWREGTFQLPGKSDTNFKLYFRYSAINDRKIFGAEKNSEYYRRNGNPNYNNLTGLISRSKKRELFKKRLLAHRNFKITKTNDQTTPITTSIADESIPVVEDVTKDAKVTFTVVLPPKTNSSNDQDDGKIEPEHKSKRQRHRSRSSENGTQFTVNLDSKDKPKQSSKSINKDKDLEDITDARQILERKRRNRK